MALTLNLAVLPVAAGLLAGTGAITTYATAPAKAPVEIVASLETPAPAPQSAAIPRSAAVPSPLPPAASPCDAQTWPYIDGTCGTTASNTRRVRVVTAPRADELTASAPRSIPHVANPEPPAGNLQSSDTVLRSPDIVVPPKISKREKRAEARRERRERRYVSQSYQVPQEAYDRRLRPIIVVRPLRLEAFR